MYVPPSLSADSQCCVLQRLRDLHRLPTGNSQGDRSGPARKALHEVGAVREETRPVSNADTDVIHLRADKMFPVTWRAEPHLERALGRRPISSRDVLCHADHALPACVAALVTARRRAAIRPKVVEVPALCHIPSMVEGGRRADRIFLELRQSGAPAEVVGDLDGLRRLLLEYAELPRWRRRRGLRGRRRWCALGRGLRLPLTGKRGRSQRREQGQSAQSDGNAGYQRLKPCAPLPGRRSGHHVFPTGDVPQSESLLERVTVSSRIVAI